MKKNVIKLNESQLRSMVMEVTRQALKGMKGATKDVHAKANEQSPEEKKYNRATSKPKPSHWKPLGKNDYENMRNGNVDGLSDKAVNMLHATMNNDDKAYRKAKYGELKEDTNMDIPKFDNVDNDQIPADGNYTDILVPEHCLNYLVNGDLTGYEDDEIEAMQRFESKWAGRIANGLIIGDICIPMEGRYPSFEPKNDVYGWLGCDCYRFMVPLKGSEEDTVNNNEPVKLSESQLKKLVIVAESASNTYLEAKRIINGKPFNDVANLPSVDERFSYGSLNGGEGEGLVDLNFKDILVTVRNENGVANIVSYEQYDENEQFDDLIYINEHKRKNTIKLNESQLREIISSVIMESLGKEGIHIKEKNRGKFTATKERTGKSTEELTHSKNPLTRKRAIFAQNAKKWNKKK